MICQTCHGNHYVRNADMNSRAFEYMLCPDCGGCGVSHCCDGDAPSVRDEVIEAVKPAVVANNEGDGGMSDHEITGLVSPLPDALCRYRIGHESGEVFDEGDDYDGLTLTIEIDTLDQGLAFVAALRDRRDEASEW